MEIGIVRFFQSIACGFFDVFFWIITKMGEETFFLLAFMGLYLCYSKKFAIKYSLYYLLSVGINSLTKIVVRRPRPYISSDKIVDRLHASGMSFPSGHCQGYFVQGSTIWYESNAKVFSKIFKKLFMILFLMFGLLVMISRMYWGQHYPTDVCVGMMFGLLLPFLFEWIGGFFSSSWKSKLTEKWWFLFLLILSSILFIVFFIIQFTIGFYSIKVYKFLGVFLSIGIGGLVDLKWIKYTSNKGWKYGLLKFAIAIIVVFLLYLAISCIIPIVSFMYFVVYLFLGLICTICLPLLYKYFFK